MLCAALNLVKTVLKGTFTKCILNHYLQTSQDFFVPTLFTTNMNIVETCSLVWIFVQINSACSVEVITLGF